MTNTIGAYIISTLANVVDIMLDEDATAAYPYAVYGLNVSEESTKNGPYRLAGTLRINLYADDFATLKLKNEAIIAALATALRTEQYRGKLQKTENTCDDGIWTAALEYSIAQYNIETED